LWSKSLLVQQ
jgi:hypothetical protein